MNFPHGETVTIETRVSDDFDRYGNPTYTWISTTVQGCAFDPGNSTETVAAFRQAVNTQPTLYAPPGTVVRATDRITVRGEVFFVDGEAGEWVSPFTGWTPGVVVKLTRTEG